MANIIKEELMRHLPRYDETPLEVDSEKALFDTEKISSAVLRRLIEEVRTEKLEPATVYNRTHNRHNRGR